jgi:acetyltransferase-like isoleucine patch superfamily enzyme
VIAVNHEEIKELQSDLADFLLSQERLWTFQLKVPASQRISAIYSIIFAGKQKYRFYFNFLLARIAQYIDWSPAKVFLYRLIGVKIGKGVFISPDVILDPHFPSLIELQDYVILGWGVKVFTHEFTGGVYRIGRIVIGEETIVGGFSTIRGGVSISAKAEVPPYCIVYKDDQVLASNFVPFKF